MHKNFDHKGFLFSAACISIIVLSIQAAEYSGDVLAQTLPENIILSLLETKPSPLSGGQASIVPIGAPLRQFADDSEIRLGFVGDIMLDRGVKSKILLHGDGSYDFPFQYVGDTLRSYDILFGNLEGPISDKGANRGSIYSFRMDPKAAISLSNAGFDVLSAANNHIGDWGDTSMMDTFVNLKNENIVPVGGGLNNKEAHAPKILEVRGTKIAYLAYSQFGKGYTEASDDTPGIAIIDEDSIIQDVSYAKSVADIIVVSFHFGDEYNDMPNEFQKRISHITIDAGADIVVGHHPHVVEQIEEYKGKTIAYSLGNFIFDQVFSSDTMTGMMLEIVIKENKIESFATTTVFINSNFQPQLAK